MSFPSIFKFEEKESLMHKFDPRIKLLLLISLSITTIIIGNPFLLFIIFLSTILFWFLLKPNLLRIKGILIAYAIIGFGFIISQGFFYYWEPKTVLFVLIPSNLPILGPLTGGINFYLEGLIYGALQSIRILTTINLSLLIISSTHPSKFILALNKIGVPYTLSFMVATAIRFAPVLLDEGTMILNAMKVRGLDTKGFKKFRALKLLFFPLLNNSLKNARQLAISAEVRAFRAHKRRTFLKELKLSKKDYILFLYAIIFLIIGIYLSLIGFGASAPGFGGI